MLDAATRAIFAHADRVETFRLDDFHEGEARSKAENAAIAALPDITVQNGVVA